MSPNDADNVGNAKWLYPPLNGGVNSLAFRGPLPSRRFVVTYGRLSIFPPNYSQSFQSSFSSLFTNMISYPFPSFHFASAQISCNGPRYQSQFIGRRTCGLCHCAYSDLGLYCYHSQLSQRMLRNQKSQLTSRTLLVKALSALCHVIYKNSIVFLQRKTTPAIEI